MPRTREFDCDEALESAMQVFWKKGFEATSIQDLVNATGVNRASLYAAYGGKRQLFERALERFRQAALGSLPPGLAGIRAFFRHVADQTLTDPRGCLLLNTVTELSTGDASICRMGQTAREELERFFAARLAEAAAGGEVPPGKNTPAVARFLTAAIYGLRTMAKTGPDRQLVDDIVTTTLSVLR